MHALSSTLREDDVGGGRIYGAFDSTARPRGRGCRGLAEGQPRSLRAGKIIVGATGTAGCSDGYVVASLRFASHGTGAFEPPRAAAPGCGMVRNSSRTRTELLGCGTLGGLKPRSWHRDARPSPNGSGQPAASDAIRLDNATGSCSAQTVSGGQRAMLQTEPVGKQPFVGDSRTGPQPFAALGV